MIDELDEIGEVFYQLWGVLDDAVVAWLARRGPQAKDFGDDFRRARSLTRRYT
jgi:hypothetical protein